MIVAPSLDDIALGSLLYNYLAQAVVRLLQVRSKLHAVLLG